jgi:hypothetical protein
MSELLPCPFCGGLKEITIKENRHSPTMKGEGSLISVDIKHWCYGRGIQRLLIGVTGRDYDQAINTWNTRTPIAQEAQN